MADEANTGRVAAGGATPSVDETLQKRSEFAYEAGYDNFTVTLKEWHELKTSRLSAETKPSESAAPASSLAERDKLLRDGEPIGFRTMRIQDRIKEALQRIRDGRGSIYLTNDSRTADSPSGQAGSAPSGGASSPLSASSSPEPSASSAQGSACSEGGADSLLRPCVQVTPEMLDAGMAVYFEHDWEHSEVAPFLKRVFCAMLSAARASRAVSQEKGILDLPYHAPERGGR